MSKAVFCIVNISKAERIVDRLKVAGFSNNDISVIMADKSGTRDFAHKKNTKAPGRRGDRRRHRRYRGRSTGVAGGNWISAIPGLGPLIAAGPIMAALTGAAVGGSVGGLTGALIGMGIPEYEAKQYEGKVKGGNALISVHSENSDETDRAKKIFEAEGAEDISSKEEAAVAKSGR